MRSVLELPVTTGTSGSCIIIICPQSATYPNIIPSATTANYPFASTAASNLNLIYGPTTTHAGPFHPQVGNMIGYLPDQCKVTFQCTQSALNASGRIYAGVYY